MKAKIDTGQISFFSNGENLIDYTIYGAAGGVGDRTANILNIKRLPSNTFTLDTNYFMNGGAATTSIVRVDNAQINIDNNNNNVTVTSYFGGYGASFLVPIVQNKAYTLSYMASKQPSGSKLGYSFRDNNGGVLLYNATTEDNIVFSDYPNNTKYINLVFRYSPADHSVTYSSIMLNEGDTVLPYEPYGYKIPITCGGITINIYLNEPLYEGDSITFSMAQVDIPTNNGQNTLTVDTQVKPSKIMVKTNEGIFQNPPENKSFSDYHYNRKMDTRNEILRAWATKDNGRIIPKSWNHVQFLVKHGLHQDIFNIKDQFIMQKDNTNLVWDIIGVDHDTPSDPQYTRSMTLQLHDCFPTMIQFDAPEAFYYCEEGLPIGTYHFKIDPTYDATYNSFKDTGYQFTLTKPVPAGGQLTFPWGSNVNASTIKVNSFASATSMTPIEQVVVSEGTGGQGLGTLTIAGDFTNNLNSIERVRYGSNNYHESAIRQWLNSAMPAGQVWTPQTKWDRPPTWAATTAGFMNGMDADFLAVIGKTHIITARNTVCDGGGYDEMDDYFFLPSRREVYSGNEAAGVIEGESYPYYADYSDLSAPGTGADSNRIKYRGGTARYWWLRTPNSGYGHAVRGVLPTGAMASDGARVSGGVALACNII